MPFNVFVTRRIPQAGLDLLKAACATVDVFPEDRAMTKEELMAAVKDRDGVLCLLNDRIDMEVLSAANQAEVFSNYAVGYNNIDVGAATKLGIMVTNTPGVLTAATADMAWALLLAAARRIPESDRYVREGKFTGWGPRLIRGYDVSGKTLGIIGAGRIGHAMVQRAAGFDMEMLYVSRNGKPGMRTLGAKRVELKVLLAQSDFISLHVPLTEETRHMIGKKELVHMKKGAILINTARGPIVDEDALVKALKSGHLAAAGLDVYENEPQVHPGLMTLENVVMAPHTGSATYGTRDAMAVMAAEDLLAALRGDTPEHLVNPAVLD